jgi:hypothetical protein
MMSPNCVLHPGNPFHPNRYNAGPFADANQASLGFTLNTHPLSMDLIIRYAKAQESCHSTPFTRRFFGCMPTA